MSDRWIPQNKTELIDGIEREWTVLMKTVERLNEKQLNTPGSGGWAPKDQLAHLAEWMKALMGNHLDRRPLDEVLGVEKQLTDVLDFDGINAVLYARNRDLPVRDVLTELRHVYTDLLSRLEAMLYADLLEPRFTDDPEQRPVLNWVLLDTVEHFREHRLTIEKSSQ